MVEDMFKIMDALAGGSSARSESIGDQTMDFELTKEQKDIQQAAREFAEGEFDKDLAIRAREGARLPARDLGRRRAQLGFVGIHFPEEYGGQGLGVFENALVVEEFCRRDSRHRRGAVPRRFRLGDPAARRHRREQKQGISSRRSASGTDDLGGVLHRAEPRQRHHRHGHRRR
ncbi:MAG: acyl-CoA dehydrogenase family protein [Marinilabiliales bacterium]|nr:acyl-CoA dehydrogenase family protein [Marinilabiliales bacterium]